MAVIKVVLKVKVRVDISTLFLVFRCFVTLADINVVLDVLMKAGFWNDDVMRVVCKP